MVRINKPFRLSFLRWPGLVLGLLLLAEIFLRIFYSGSLELKREPLVYQPSLAYGFLPIPGARGEFVTNGVRQHLQLNNMGFIGDDLTEKKKDHLFRVIIVGFSNCEGYYVAYASGSVKLLGDLFRKNGYTIEILNCSIGGGYYRKIQQYRFLKEVVARYDADLILFETGLPFFDYYVSREIYRDFTIEYSTGSENSRRVAREVVDEMRSHPFLTSFYDNCYLSRAVAKWYLKHDSSRRLFTRCLGAYVNNKVKFVQENTLNTTYSIGRSVELLRGLHDSLLTKGTKLVFFQIPDEGFSSRTQKFNNILRVNRLPCLEISIDPVAGGPSAWIEGSGHLNEYGHRLLAASLYKGLLDSGYIPASVKEAQQK